MIMTGVSAETSCDGAAKIDVRGGGAGQAEHKIGSPSLGDSALAVHRMSGALR